MILDIVELPLRLKKNEETGVNIVFNYNTTQEDNPDDYVTLGHWVYGEDIDDFRLYKSIEAIGPNVMMERVFFSQNECNPLKWTEETDVRNITIYPVYYRRFDVRDCRLHQTGCFKYAKGIKQFLWAIGEECWSLYDASDRSSIGDFIAQACDHSKLDPAVSRKLRDMVDLIPMNDGEITSMVADIVDVFYRFGTACCTTETIKAMDLNNAITVDGARRGVCKLSQFYNFSSVGSLGLYSALLRDRGPTESEFAFNPMQIYDLYLYSILADIANAPYTDIDIHVDLAQDPITTYDVRNRYIQGLPYPERQVRNFCNIISQKIQSITSHKLYGGKLDSWDSCHIRKTWEEEIFVSFWDGGTPLVRDYISIPFLAVSAGTVC